MASYCNLCELRSLIHTNRSSKYDTSYIYWSTDFRWKHLKIEQTKHERLHKHKHRSMAEKNKLNIIYLEGGRPNRWNGLQRTIRRCKINTQEQEKIALFRFDCLLFFSCSQRSCFTFLRTTFFVFSFFLLHIIFVCVFALMTSIGLYGCSIHTADSHTPHTRASARDEQRRCATTSRDTHANSAATIFEQTNRKEPRTNEFQDYIVRE